MAEESSERKQRHFSYQDLSLDKAYIIGFSLKDNLKNLPETKERDKYSKQEEISHIPILWCHASCLTQGRFQQRPEGDDCGEVQKLDLETCRQANMALGPRAFSERLFQGLYENTGGEGD